MLATKFPELAAKVLDKYGIRQKTGVYIKEKYIDCAYTSERDTTPFPILFRETY